MVAAARHPDPPQPSSGVCSALLEVRVLPWRPRTRVMKASSLREVVSGNPIVGVDDIAGLAFSLGTWLFVMIAAPLLVLVLAAVLFSVELPIVLAIGLVLVVTRFAGVIPWTVVIVDRVTGADSTESYRNGLRALRRIRNVNAEQRLTVRWAWA